MAQRRIVVFLLMPPPMPPAAASYAAYFYAAVYNSDHRRLLPLHIDASACRAIDCLRPMPADIRHYRLLDIFSFRRFAFLMPLILFSPVSVDASRHADAAPA